MRPLFPTSVTVSWRDRETIQVGVDPTRARVVSGVDERVVDWLRSLDGSRSHADAVTAAGDAGLAPPDAAVLLGELGRAGAIVDGSGRGLAELSLDAATREQIAPLLEGLSLAGRDPNAALLRRGRSTVVLRGSERLTVPIGALLGAAGVGRVHIATHGAVAARDVAACGFGVADIGRPRATAAADAIHRTAPRTDTRRPPPASQPELVILAGTAALDPELTDPLQRRRTPHLPCWIRETTALLGPLVRPGQTCCLRCVDLHRADRDPAWPAVCSQLVSRRELPGGDPGLTAMLAGSAAVAALAQLDGADPAVLHTSIETSSSDGRTRRRLWAPHPRCGCTDPELRETSWQAAG